MLRRTHPIVQDHDRAWWNRLAPYVGSHRRRLIFCVVVSVVGQAFVGLLPLIQKVIVDDAVLTQRRPLWPWLGLMMVVGTVGFGLHYIRRYSAAKVSLTLQHELRVAIYRQLHRLDPSRLDELSPGEIMSRAAGDVTLVQMFVNQIPLFAANVTLLVVALTVMLVLSPLLSLVILALVPLFIFLSMRFRDRVFVASFSDQRNAAAVAGVVEEAVSGVRIVKAFAQESRETGLLIERARALFRSRLRTSRLTAGYSATLQALPTFGQLGVLALGGWLALHERLSLGVVLAFFTYLVQLLAPVRLLSSILSGSQQARVGAERVLAFLELTPRIADPPRGGRAIENCQGAIEFSNVTFRYPTQPGSVLGGVSFSVAPGERFGIVGASGSGKTTLALLMARFYDPTSGRVLLDGVDVRGLTVASLRRQIGIVAEDSFLFSATIRENIAFGKPDASDAEVEAAARAAQVHDFIVGLPKGYSSRVGEAGSSLSGGQRQRITLARMFLQNPKVLVLDDATSAIDAQTEEQIFESLQRLMNNRTTVIIAHRPSTLRLVERCIVLDGGRVVADDTPATLLQSSDHYRRLLYGPEASEESSDPVFELTHLDPRAWPKDVSAEGAKRAPSLETEVNWLALKGSSQGGGGGGARDLGVGRAAFATETPELLAREALLPPLTGEPDVPIDDLVRESGRLRMRDILRPFAASLFACLVLVGVDALTSLVAPALIGHGVDNAIVGKQESVLWWVVAALFAVYLVSWFNARVMQYRTARTTERLLFALRVRTFAHLQRLSLDYFDRELGGRIMARMTTDVESFAQLFQQGLLTAVVSLLTCGGVLFVLLAMDWRLSLVAFLVLPLLVLGTVVFRRWSRQAYLDARERIARLYGNLQESIGGVQVTQSFAREAAQAEQFGKLSDAYRVSRTRSMQLMSVYFPFLQFLSVFGKTITLGFGAHLIAHGNLAAGTLVAFLLYLDQFFAPLQQLSGVFDQWIQARVSLGRLRELLAVKSATPEALAPIDPGVLAGKLTFEGVRFAYAPTMPEALRGVDLEIRPGEQVSLVGTTGAGKSTFVKLAARFYDPTGGRVLVDDIPLTDVALQPFRRQVGYVPQEAFLFSGTVRSNIAYGRPNATDLDIERAARAVGAHEFICQLSDGYLTPIAARGRTLSAGQRQLLCLARAELINPRILILDEATAKLDLETEAEVKVAMRRVARGRTSLLIAHRLQTARVADRILVLDEGRIVENGSHEQLLRLKGRYHHLWSTFTHAERPR